MTEAEMIMWMEPNAWADRIGSDPDKTHAFWSLAASGDVAGIRRLMIDNEVPHHMGGPPTCNNGGHKTTESR